MMLGMAIEEYMLSIFFYLLPLEIPFKLSLRDGALILPVSDSFVIKTLIGTDADSSSVANVRGGWVLSATECLVVLWCFLLKLLLLVYILEILRPVYWDTMA